MLSAVLEQALYVQRAKLASVPRRLSRGTVEREETFRRAKPERALRLEDGIHLNRVGAGDVEVPEGVVLPIVAAEPRGGPDPDRLLRVLVDRERVVGGEARRVSGAIAVDREPVAVVAVQPFRRAEPHEPTTVLMNRLDARARETIVRGERPELQLLRVRFGSRERQAADGERSAPDSRAEAPNGRRHADVDARGGSARRH